MIAHGTHITGVATRVIEGMNPMAEEHAHDSTCFQQSVSNLGFEPATYE